MKFASPSSVILDLKSIAQNMREVSRDIVNTESQKVTSRWYHSEKEADLFIWQDEKNNIIKQQVSVHGAVSEWNIIEGVKTGIVLQDDTRSHPHEMDGSEVIQFDEEVQKAALAQAIELLSHLEAVTGHEKNHLIENFKQDKSVANMDPEAFLRIYGHKIQPAPRRPWYRYTLDRMKRLLKRLFSRH